MKSSSKILFVATLALASGATLSAARADVSVSYQYPKQYVYDARQITATHPLNCFRPAVEAAEETKLDVVVNFDTGSDKLTKKGMHEVAKAAALIKKHLPTTAHVLVEGYTDAKGKSGKNQDLSYRRALRVVNTLTQKFGIPAQVALAKGFGDTKPVATNSTPAGRAANRRVEFVIVKK